MLKNKLKIVAVLLAIVLLFSTTLVFAVDEETDVESIDTTDEALLTEEDENLDLLDDHDYSDEEIKNSDIYIFDNDVTIDYMIDGNLYVMGNNVTISSQINGDAFIMAKSITITEEGYVYSNLFAMGESVSIKGVVYNAYVLGQEFNLENGYVYRDAKIAAGTINISGVIGRDANFACSSLNFKSESDSYSTMIYGDLVYSSGNEASIPEGAVAGEVKFEATNLSEGASIGEIILNYILEIIEFIVLAIVVFFALLWLAPKFLETTNNYVGKLTGRAFGYGAITLFLVPIAIVILFALSITVKVGLAVLWLYIAAFSIAKAIFAIVANNYICTKLNIEKLPAKVGMLAATGAVTYVLISIPYIGWICGLAAVLFGLGVTVNSIIPKKEKADKESK